MNPATPAHSISVSHTFETGHRLPHLPGKCQSLHGHSWKVEVSVDLEGPLESDGIVVNFSAFKAWLRDWIDRELDHGLMLGGDDPLVKTFKDAEYPGKIFIFDNESGRPAHRLGPTVENVAELIGRYSQLFLNALKSGTGPHHEKVSPPAHPDAYVSYVTVSETSTNDATWIAPVPDKPRVRLFPGETL